MLTYSSFICTNPLFSANRHFGQIVQYSFRQSTYNQKEISKPTPAFFSANQNHPNGTKIQSMERQVPEYRRYAHPPQAFRNTRIQSRSKDCSHTIPKVLPRISLPIDIDEPALHSSVQGTQCFYNRHTYFSRPSTRNFQCIRKLYSNFQ